MPFQLFKNAQTMPLEPVMVLLGPDPFVRQKLRESLIERSLGKSLREMNFSRFYAGEDEMARAMDACRDFPCFAERRVVLISQIEKVKKKDGEEIGNYLQTLQPSTLLILEGKKLDGRLEWVKILKKRARLLEIPEVGPSEGLAWVRKCFSREGKTIEDGVSEKLLELIGTSLGSLQQAVIQLCLYGGDRTEISLSDLDSLFIKVSEENVFAVVESLFSEDVSVLHRSLDRLLQSGEPPLKILALIYRHLSILFSLRFGKRGETWRSFRMPPGFRRLYEEQAGRYGARLNFGLLRPMAEADLALKGSPLPNSLILKSCVEQIAERLK